MKGLVTLAILCSATLALSQTDPTHSMDDLSFLVGEWDVKRTYGPSGKEPRQVSGSLSCHWSLDSTFIRCVYEIQRPGKKRSLDLVFFNYNAIYEAYESMWLSSTWPIKVLMRGYKTVDQSFTYTAEFPIGNNATEYVKSQWIANRKGSSISSFSRETFIRTSNNENWSHHMDEIAAKVKTSN